MRKAFICLSAGVATFLMLDVASSIYVDFAHASVSNAEQETTVVNRSGKGDRMMSMHVPSRSRTAPAQQPAAQTPPESQQQPTARQRWPEGCEPAASPLSPSGSSAIGARCLS